jgi:two-component system NarL family sensor kinase
MAGKKSPILLLCVSLGLYLVSPAQSVNIDSFLNVAKSADGPQQIEIYATIARLNRNSNSDTGLHFANLAYALAEKSGSDKSKMYAYLAMGQIQSVRGGFDLSTKYYRQALEIAEDLKLDSMKALCLNGLGASLWQLGKHVESLEHHYRALQLREKLQDPVGAAIAKTNIGMVYQSQDKLQLAEYYVRQALDELQDAPDPSLRITTMHTLANIYGQSGKIKEAFALDTLGIKIAERTNNELAKSLFYDNMGNCYLYGTPPDYDKAIEYFQRTLKIDSAFNNKKQMCDSYGNLGDVFFQQKKFSQAIPYLLRCVQLADESGYVQGKVKGLRMLSVAYRESGNSNQALSYLQQSVHVKDSLVSSSGEKRIAELQTVYETEKKQQQINLQQAQLSRKNSIIVGVALAAVLLGLLGLSAWRRSRLKQTARMQREMIRQQELATKAVIEAEEEERQRIARDLHDGVGQMMSAAKMNLSAFESGMHFPSVEQQSSFEKIIGLVDESCKEIRHVSHNMMPNALLKRNLSAAVQDFIDKIDKKALQIELYTEGLDERLDANVETVLYRVIQECVNNVIKHAKATKLDISLIRDADGINATIEDNGVGFDATDKEKSSGIGLKNIVTRVEYLKGTVDFDAAVGRGTVVALHVPIVAA